MAVPNVPVDAKAGDGNGSGDEGGDGGRER